MVEIDNNVVYSTTISNVENRNREYYNGYTDDRDRSKDSQYDRDCGKIWRKRISGPKEGVFAWTCNSYFCEKCIPSRINTRMRTIIQYHGNHFYIHEYKGIDMSHPKDVDNAYMTLEKSASIGKKMGLESFTSHLTQDSIIIITNNHPKDNDDIPHEDKYVLMVADSREFKALVKKMVYRKVTPEIKRYILATYKGARKIRRHNIEKSFDYETVCCVNEDDKKYALKKESYSITPQEAEKLPLMKSCDVEVPLYLTYAREKDEYLKFDEFVNKVEWDDESFYIKGNKYIIDWYSYFGSGVRSKKLWEYYKEKYKKTK